MGRDVADNYIQRIETFASLDWTDGVSQRLQLLLLDIIVGKACFSFSLLPWALRPTYTAFACYYSKLQ